MKKHTTIGVAAIMVATGTLSPGCADDRKVYHDDPVTDGGMGGTGGTTTATGGSGNTGTGGSGNTGNTGGNSADIPVNDIDNVFSFDIHESDNYDEWSFWENKASQLASCISSDACMEEAWNDTPGREFQFLGTGVYQESFKPLMKGFCRYFESGTCGSDFKDVAGDGCEESDGDSRACLVALWFEFSASNGDRTGTGLGNAVYIGPESGDKCMPFIACGGYEHAANIGRDGMTPLSAQVNNGTVVEAKSYAEKLQLEAEMRDIPSFNRPLVLVKSSARAVTLGAGYKGLPE